MEKERTEALLRCKTDHTRLITKMLGALCMKEKQVLSGPMAWCQISPKGLRFTTEESASVQSRVYLPDDLFREYKYLEVEPTTFSINLGATMECLRILDGHRGSGLGSPPSLYIGYDDTEATLSLTLIEGSVVTECEISTFDQGSPKVHGMGSTAQSCRVVLRADALREGLQELDWGDANHKDKTIGLSVQTKDSTLRFTVRNADCGCEMAFPVEAVTRFDASTDVSEAYRFSALQAISRALAAADEACLRVMHEGALSIMLRLSDGNKTGFVEYFVSPLLDLEDMEGNDAVFGNDG